jgi:hypothetical protein
VVWGKEIYQVRKTMPDLSKHTELTDITFDHDNAHLAVCHVSQGYSANGRPDALLFKANQPITKAALDSLKDIYPTETITKMTSNSKRSYLESLIMDALKATFDGYIWAYVTDFNEDMVAFNYEDSLWAVGYSVEGDSGTITLSDTPRKVIRGEVYIGSESGEVLIKSAAFKELQITKTTTLPEDNIKSDDIKKENTKMSDKLDVQELLKSSEAQELLKAMAADLAKEQFEELQKAAQLVELTKSTSEILKGFEVIVEDDVEGIVKCLVSIDQNVAGTVLKALGDMQSEIVKVKAEKEEIKKEFGEKQTTKEVSVDINKGNEDRAAQLTSVVNKMKAK